MGPRPAYGVTARGSWAAADGGPELKAAASHDSVGDGYGPNGFAVLGVMDGDDDDLVTENRIRLLNQTIVFLVLYFIFVEKRSLVLMSK